jgi:bacteriocin biosynthesis cyclodehydratase domain-containing protein
MGAGVLKDFDVIALADGGYELVSGRSVFRVGFDNVAEKSMFDTLVEYRTKPPRDVFRRLIKRYERSAVFSFFDKLRLAGLVFYDDEAALVAGRAYDKSTAMAYQMEAAAATPIAIVSGSPLGAILKSFEIFSNATLIDARKLNDPASLETALASVDFVVVDASSHNPEQLDLINRTMLQRCKPWLLLQGIYERHGHVGPMFFGRDTGCYHCFRERMRSNVSAVEAFDRYERWLVDGDRFSQESLHASEAFVRHIASIAAMETEKFIFNFEVPQTYGYLLSVDPRTYRIEPHRLYKLPFCETCNPNFEYRRAPWLDSVTLGVA